MTPLFGVIGFWLLTIGKKAKTAYTEKKDYRTSRHSPFFFARAWLVFEFHYNDYVPTGTSSSSSGTYSLVPGQVPVGIGSGVLFGLAWPDGSNDQTDRYGHRKDTHHNGHSIRGLFCIAKSTLKVRVRTQEIGLSFSKTG
jgi:hypothetical protein